MKILINACYGGFGIRDDIKYSGNPRTNANLIKMVELGEDIGDAFCEIEIVEIPDDATDYAVIEYDGLESAIYVVDGKINWA